MPRNSAGVYTLTSNNPVVTGTTIATATWANLLFPDLATEMTDSLSRSGKGPMTAALKIINGVLGAPGIAFNNETNTGWFLKSTGVIALAVAGVEVLNYSTANGLVTVKPISINGQDVETGITGNASTIANLNTLSGVAADATNLGTFTGSTITDNVTDKVALQELETAVEGTVVGAYLNQAGSQTIANNTSTPLVFVAGDVSYDTDTFWAVGNADRLSVPNGFAFARCTFEVGFDADSTGIRNCAIEQFNSSDVRQANINVITDATSAGVWKGCVSSGWLAISDGDYFEFTVTQTSGGNLDIDNSSAIQEPNVFIEVRL